MFLCETRQSAKKVSRLRSRLGLRDFCGVDSVGQSGGLTLFWNEQLSVEIKEKKERFIDAHIRASSTDPFWHLTCVYGEPRTENRHRMWTILSDIRASSDLPWMLMGDFNEAMWQCEHLSVTPCPASQIAAFREVVQDCELHDLGFAGAPFTYDNRRRGRANVKVRLDRALADDQWRDFFSDASVVHLVSPCSNHLPLLVHLQKEEVLPPRQRPRQYEVFWERAGELPELI